MDVNQISKEYVLLFKRYKNNCFVIYGYGMFLGVVINLECIFLGFKIFFYYS